MIKNLVASLQHLRHVRAGVGDLSLASSLLGEANKESEAPRWFRALVRAPAETAVIPVAMRNGGTESIILVADPADEIDEVWEEARENALEGGLIALAAIAVTSLLVGRAVKPSGSRGRRSRGSRPATIPRAPRIAGPPRSAPSTPRSTASRRRSTV